MTRNPYSLTTPCSDCPFLITPGCELAFPLERLAAFASEGQFCCHKTCDVDEDSAVFVANDKRVICAGMLIFNEKRDQPNQMMRISERLGMYDPRKLDMGANVR